MTAIVTNDFRVVNAQNFKEDITDADNSVYVFIGKSDAWSDSIDDLADATPPDPIDSPYEQNLAYKNMIAAKVVTSSDVTHVVPRHDWTSGEVYYAWDDSDPDIYSTGDHYFYVITDERKVFKCLDVGPAASVVKPTLSQVPPFALGDGYTWKYLYTLAIVDSEKFLTNFYMPVKTVLLPESGLIGDLSESDQAQYTNQQSAIASLSGKIYRSKVVSGGSGYTYATLTVDGDGTGATATATVAGGVITGVTMTNVGSNYNIARIVITGDGVGGEIHPILAASKAHGSDPVAELGAYFIGVNTRLEYDDGSGDFIVDNSFRQVGLIRNPLNPAGNAVSTATTFNGLKTLSLASGTGFTASDYITGASSGAVAYIDDFDSDSLVIKFHQNEKTGYKSFQNSENVVGDISGSGAALGSGAVSGPEYSPNTGYIIFLENRGPLNRSAAQIEDVKIIIEF